MSWPPSLAGSGLLGSVQAMVSVTALEGSELRLTRICCETPLAISLSEVTRVVELSTTLALSASVIDSGTVGAPREWYSGQAADTVSRTCPEYAAVGVAGVSMMKSCAAETVTLCGTFQLAVVK